MDTQAMSAALRNPSADSISDGVPAILTELNTLGRTLSRRAADVLAITTDPARVTAQPRPSTAGSNTSEDSRSGSET